MLTTVLAGVGRGDDTARSYQKLSNLLDDIADSTVEKFQAELFRPFLSI